MYEQPELNTWGIFHGDKDAQTAKQFSSTLDEVLKQFGFVSQAPRTFTVKGNPMQGRSWVTELKNNLNSEVQAIILLMPGQKGRPNAYDEVKRFLLAEFPIPSQVVLCNTISRGKNLRSIINKILI
jgi:putative heme iron utilization protein